MAPVLVFYTSVQLGSPETHGHKQYQRCNAFVAAGMARKTGVQLQGRLLNGDRAKFGMREAGSLNCQKLQLSLTILPFLGTSFSKRTARSSLF